MNTFGFYENALTDNQLKSDIDTVVHHSQLDSDQNTHECSRKRFFLQSYPCSNCKFKFKDQVKKTFEFADTLCENTQRNH